MDPNQSAGSHQVIGNIEKKGASEIPLSRMVAEVILSSSREGRKSNQTLPITGGAL